MIDNSNRLGIIIRQQRYMKSMSLREVAVETGVSISYLHHIEKGTRFPSMGMLQKIAGPLGFDDRELMTVAGYISPESAGYRVNGEGYYQDEKLDFFTASVLAQEPVEMQYVALAILRVFHMFSEIQSRQKAGKKKQRTLIKN